VARGGYPRRVAQLAGWLVFLRLARYSWLQRWGSWQLATLCLALALTLFPLLRSGPSKLLVITGVLAVSIVVASLSPFEWRWVGEFLWFPFAGSLGGDPIRAMEPLIEKLYLIGSLVFFVR
jgi:hypothetical protein